jgi:Stress responsive A/B Barrel Domain
LLKHIVLFRFKDFAEGADKAENIAKLKSRLEGLDDIIEEIKFFEVGMNIINSDAAYDLALYSQFESKEDLFSYQKHPEHVKVADFVKRICESRVVVDYVA